jgi:hypothetical protein
MGWMASGWMNFTDIGVFFAIIALENPGKIPVPHWELWEKRGQDARDTVTTAG